MLLLLLIILFYLLCEYRCYKTCITPFFIIGIIYFVSVPFINIVGPKLGYFKISNDTIYMFMLYLSLIFFSDIVFKICMVQNKVRHYKDNAYDYYNEMFVKQQKIIWYTFVVFLIGYSLSFFEAVNIYGISAIKGKSNGIFGHMGLACISISPLIVLLLIKTRKIKYFFGIISLFMIMLLFGGKTYIFIAIITSGILLNIEYQFNFSKLVKLGLLFIILAISIFIIIYTLIPCISTGNMDITTMKSYARESMQHIFYYFASPFLSSNSYFNMPLKEGFITGIRIMFAPIVSIYELLFGNKNYPHIIMTEWAPISESAHRTVTNVGGLFSESVFHIGYLYSFLYVLLICFYVNIIYFINKKTNHFSGSTSLAISLLGLCFFVNYFMLLVVLEMIIYLMLFEVFLLILYQKKIYIKDWRIKRTWKNIRL